jgi:hypothetical protein
MAQENSAHGAPRGGFAPTRANGCRRVTLEMRAWLDRADSFKGLPPGTAKPLTFLYAFKEAEPYLGLPAHTYKLVDWLVRLTKPQDWEEGSRPIAWPQARRQEEFLGLSERRTQALNRVLQEAGAPRATKNGANAIKLAGNPSRRNPRWHRSAVLCRSEPCCSVRLPRRRRQHGGQTWRLSITARLAPTLPGNRRRNCARPRSASRPCSPSPGTAWVVPTARMRRRRADPVLVLAPKRGAQQKGRPFEPPRRCTWSALNW